MIELDERSIRKKLETTLRAHGEEHPETALCHMDLGDKFELDGRWDRAQQEYLKAADIFTELGIDHELLLAIALKSAAEMARIQDNLEDAKLLKARARELVKIFCRRDLGSPDYDDAA